MTLTTLLAIALIIALWCVLRLKPNNLIELSPTKRKQKAAISTNRFNELTKMVGTVTARKLVKENLEKYPDRSPSWACNKAISDLERDRRI